jgi:hypothetical protein
MTRVNSTGACKSFRGWSSAIGDRRYVTDLDLAVMDDERDTDSGRVTQPTGDILELEFDRFQKPIRIVGRRLRIFYRCCYLDRVGDYHGCNASGKRETNHQTPYLEAYTESDTPFAPELRPLLQHDVNFVCLHNISLRQAI